MSIYGYAGKDGSSILDLRYCPCVICNGYIDAKGTNPDMYGVQVMNARGREYYTYVHKSCWGRLSESDRGMILDIMLAAISLDCDNRHNVQNFGTVN